MTDLFALVSPDLLSLVWSGLWSVLSALGLAVPFAKAGFLLATFLWVFWVLYVATMAVYRLHLAGQLKQRTTSRFTLGMCYSLVAIALLVDWIAQYTVATVFFLDWPERGERLVTDRLQRYVSQPWRDWRSDRAHYVCTHLLDLFDPTGDHCKRSKA